MTDRPEGLKWTVPGEKYPTRWAPAALPTTGNAIGARERAQALFILGSAVAIQKHPYERSPHSGSGNCWCGDHRRAKIHEVLDGHHWMRERDIDLSDVEATTDE